MNLYFGCGKHRIKGFIGIDKIKTEAVDIILDMNVFPYPFRNDSIEKVNLINILEHLANTVSVMEEIWRICKNEALVTIGVPYYNSPGAFMDPTHVSFFTEHTFDYFTEDGVTWLSEYNYYSHARFRIISIVPVQCPILNFLPKRIQWFLAHHLSTIHGLEFKLQTVK